MVEYLRIKGKDVNFPGLARKEGGEFGNDPGTEPTSIGAESANRAHKRQKAAT